MTKRTPTYDLGEIKRLILEGGKHRHLTNAAHRGAAALHLEPQDIIDCVIEMDGDRDFRKSMESEKVRGLWQDVYKTRYIGMAVYLKLQISGDCAVIIQFKQDESP